MAAKTSESEKARLFDLVTCVCELVRDGGRDAEEVSAILQKIKENPKFYAMFFSQDSKETKPKKNRSERKLWAKFYLEVFGLKKDFSRLKLPVETKGFDWIVVMAEGLTLTQIWTKIVERMPAYKYWDNPDDITSDRKADKDYAIRLRDRVEADEELANKSAEDLKKEEVFGITVEERLVLELFYYWQTGNHLDLENVTLCSGSRFLGGSVPVVRWGGGGLCLRWYCAHGRRDDLRSRLVVS